MDVLPTPESPKMTTLSMLFFRAPDMVVVMAMNVCVVLLLLLGLIDSALPAMPLATPNLCFSRMHTCKTSVLSVFIHFTSFPKFFVSIEFEVDSLGFQSPYDSFRGVLVM
jgi:hypothetical protein